MLSVLKPSAARGEHLRTLGALAASVLLVIGGPAAAAQTQVRQDGRLLDVNPQIGGGGANYARPTSVFLPGNAIAGGTVRGGFGLQSRSTISDPTQFRGTLGSAALSNFRRDSVSTGDVLTGLGTPLTAMPYYDPARTVGSAGFYRGVGSYGDSGFAFPDASRRAAAAPPGVRDPQDLRLDIGGDPRAFARPTGVQPPRAGELNSSIFGVSGRLTAPSDVPTNLVDASRSGALGSNVQNPAPIDPLRAATAATATNQMLPGVRPAATGALGSLLNSRPTDLLANRPTLPGVYGVDGLPPPVPSGPGVVKPDAPRTARQPSDAPPLPAPRVVDPSVLPGHDVYTDMRLALALQRSPSTGWFSEMQAAAKEDASIAAQLGEITQMEAGQFLEKMLRVPLRSLVGRGSGEVNNELLKAEGLMQVGQFYDAANRFEQARLLDPTNPLPLLGKGHALLAAGDYLSAALAIQRAFEAFPDLARFRIELQALLGGGETVDIRRADIMNRLREGEDPRLRFLLGYLEYHTGNAQSGLEHLEKAAAASPPSSLIARYPALLRGEEAALPKPPAGADPAPPLNRPLGAPQDRPIPPANPPRSPPNPAAGTLEGLTIPPPEPATGKDPR